jgi:hypothetical protein
VLLLFVPGEARAFGPTVPEVPMPQQQTAKKMNANNNKPVHTVRFGTIKAAVWRNEVDAGNASRPMYNVTVARSYKDGDDWKDASSFGVDDLLVLAKALDAAHTWIHLQKARDAIAASSAMQE